MASDLQKQAVRDFWNSGSCGEVYAVGDSFAKQLEEQARTRYELEPYLPEFARFQDGKGKDVLEIGVGMGADHLEWAKASPRSLTGIDLTPRGIDFTRQRLQAHGMASNLAVGDAENLGFADGSFDIVYSWGVIHHSPNTARAASEIGRVLRKGGQARVMIYHKHSIVGYMLWARYGLARLRPLRSLADIYANHLESPGTKAYSRREAEKLFHGFSEVRTSTILSFGDLLQGSVGQRHGGVLLSTARRVWPRWLIRSLFRGHGLYLLIEATK